ncbi:MAG: pyruvate, phosphate dikinase [Actinobacteria bacterium RBG_16_64_13]|nr:MAG: pyruvate, phosphate dikinase [Actinobacteria bacterium RBG_16_64_13]
MSPSKYVYDFSEGNATMKPLLGGKGANLAEMTGLGIPVPPGFIVTTAACVYYSANGKYPDGLTEEIEAHLRALEKLTGKTLGDPAKPLLLSIRSGAVFSMPGMMDTVLNLGLNDETVEGLAKGTGNARFAYDSYRRFISMFGDVVMGVDPQAFEDALTAKKAEAGAALDTDLSADDLRDLTVRFKKILNERAGEQFPADPLKQLHMSVVAVFKSWDNHRAKVYRRTQGIPDDLGTAVNVQTMVFGNKGETSGTGVAFTRDPSTGENFFYGEFLMNAQGEDVVAGVRHPRPLEELRGVMPEALEELYAIRSTLEKHYRDMQDLEFTIEDTTLYMLQTRNGKRTAQAALRTAAEMVTEGLITKEEALLRVDPLQLDQLLHPRLDPKATYQVLATGLGASPGAAVGQAVFDADEAEERGSRGEAVILVRWETNPDDIHGLIQAQGVITSHGGMTSHAAVVARGMGKPCIAGAQDLKIDTEAKRFAVGDVIVNDGDWISMDGASGRVILGQAGLIPAAIDENVGTVLGWADSVRRLGVRTNADTPDDARKAREFGAEGIGLCRTEHMFMQEDRLPHVRNMIMAADTAERELHLAKLLPFQREDFDGIFRAMSGLPVTIRLLDPPLHEFLPNYTEVMVELERLRLTGASADAVAAQEKLTATVKSLAEANPMLGTRGCRLGIQWPEIYAMQVRAIVEAAADVLADTGEKPHVEIMIPLVGFEEELKRMRALTVETADAVLAERGVAIDYTVGTMIEVPRAALTADEIARQADFFSFGTNDLTQMTLGFSRDDAEGKFLTHYLRTDLLKSNPFEKLDQAGVGQLVAMAVQKGRSVKPQLKTGICGEHGGEPTSVKFCHRTGLNYVSCSPYRVPLARLAAAQAVLEEKASAKTGD